MTIIVSELNAVNYGVLGKKYTQTCENAVNVAHVLNDVQKETSIVFNDVIVSRSTITDVRGKIVHQLAMTDLGGPFTSEQFLKIIQYDRSISHNNWADSIREKLKDNKDKS